MHNPEEPAVVVVEVLGIYDADGGLRGEMSYVVGKLLGRAHCGLCDITHSAVRRRRAWHVLLPAARLAELQGSVAAFDRELRAALAT